MAVSLASCIASSSCLISSSFLAICSFNALTSSFSTSTFSCFASVAFSSACVCFSISFVTFCLICLDFSSTTNLVSSACFCCSTKLVCFSVSSVISCVACFSSCFISTISLVSPLILLIIPCKSFAFSVSANTLSIFSTPPNVSALSIITDLRISKSLDLEISCFLVLFFVCLFSKGIAKFSVLSIALSNSLLLSFKSCVIWAVACSSCFLSSVNTCILA